MNVSVSTWNNRSLKFRSCSIFCVLDFFFLKISGTFSLPLCLFCFQLEELKEIDYINDLFYVSEEWGRRMLNYRQRQSGSILSNPSTYLRGRFEFLHPNSNHCLLSMKNIRLRKSIFGILQGCKENIQNYRRHSCYFHHIFNIYSCLNTSDTLRLSIEDNGRG